MKLEDLLRNHHWNTVNNLIRKKLNERNIYTIEFHSDKPQLLEVYRELREEKVKLTPKTFSSLIGFPEWEWKDIGHES